MSKLSDKWCILLALTTIWVVFSAVYAISLVHVPPNSTRAFETFKFVFLSISTYGVLFTVLLSSFNSLEAARNLKTRIEFDKTENSFLYMQRWDSEALRQARDVTRSLKKEQRNLSPNELSKKINTDPSVERSVITMFNFFEEIYLSIIASRVNEPSLRQAFSSTYVDIYRRFEAWVEETFSEDQKESLKALERKWR